MRGLCLARLVEWIPPLAERACSGGAGRGDNPGMPYTFRPMTTDDMPMLRRWLATPEVVRWWGEGDPEREAALLAEDLQHQPAMVMRIVSFDGRCFAYAQDYAVSQWPQEHLAHLPPGSRAIDAFIGKPDMIGCGHGAAFLRLLARRLIQEGASKVVIDPAAENLRARRAYARAGFAGENIVSTATGPVVVMTFRG
jgi:aminoglycoside 6'-N-acetyltransferase